MEKIVISILYLIFHPFQALRILNLYKFLKGKYRFTIILSHAFKEAVYNKRKRINSPQNINLNSETSYEKRQIIINIHDGLLRSGGLTDRLKGICTLYMMSQKRNIPFKIYFVSPFNLQKYLEPNNYDWTIQGEEICWDLSSTAIYTWENERFAKDFFQLNKEKKQLHISCNSGESYPQYSELFHELFKPTAFLSSEIDKHLQQLGGKGEYISISFRFQNLLGEFKEGNSSSINAEQQKLLINRCLDEICSIKEKHKEIEKILVTSDSNIFRTIVSNTFSYVYTYVINEETGHMDYLAGGKGKELTAFTDIFLIANAKKAYQVRSKLMYNSDFPRFAAKINNVPYELIETN